MGWNVRYAISGALPHWRPTIWWIACLVGAVAAHSGCSSVSRNAFPNPNAAPPTAVVSVTDNQAVREEARAELGEETAQAIPAMRRPVLPPADPAAALLVDSMLIRLGPGRAVGSDGNTTITLSPLRNQSRCGAAEFEGFCERLASTLTDAASDSRVRFTCQASDEAQYMMLGTAYLITAEGFDLWELYLSLSPSSEAFSLWESDGAVRLFRHARPGQPLFVQN